MVIVRLFELALFEESLDELDPLLKPLYSGIGRIDPRRRIKKVRVPRQAMKLSVIHFTLERTPMTVAQFAKRFIPSCWWIPWGNCPRCLRSTYTYLTMIFHRIRAALPSTVRSIATCSGKWRIAQICWRIVPNRSCSIWSKYRTQMKYYSRQQHASYSHYGALQLATPKTWWPQCQNPTYFENFAISEKHS